MLSIVDAFDSMTTDHLYRPARSRERALAELFEFAGSQFDPELVRQFEALFSQDQNLLTEKLARRWLHRLPKEGNAVPWNVVEYERSRRRRRDPTPSLFEKKLIDNMHDGVVFVDSQSTILLWNTGVERLTGVSSAAACGRTLLPNLMDMCNSREQRIANEDCPVAHAISTGVQWLGRVSIMGRQGRHVAVDLHAIPVRSNDGAIHGATVLLHDVSSETSLEEKCQALHAQVAKDPMTQVANRAEFDRMLNNFVAAHQESNLPCSLIMSDLDHFKSINDTYGHQAGDEAIITFASLLKTMCRSGDLVARYGGEEFAILCADCTNAAAARKAEAIRKALAEVKHASLGNAVDHRQLRRHGAANGRHAGNDAASGRPRTASSQGPGTQPGCSIRGRNDGRKSEAKLVAVPVVARRRAGRSDARHDGADRSGRAEAARLHRRPGRQDRQDERQRAAADRSPTASTRPSRRSNDRPVTFLIHLKLSQQHTERSNTQGFAAGTYVETRIEVVDSSAPRPRSPPRSDGRKSSPPAGQLEVVLDGPRRRRQSQRRRSRRSCRVTNVSER